MTQIDSDPDASPVNPLPPIVVALAILIIGPELYFQGAEAGFWGGDQGMGIRLAAIKKHAFYEPVFQWMLDNGQVRGEFLLRFVTYPFVHFNFTHVLMALVFLLALGKMVAEVFHPLAVLLVFFGASVFGAVVYGLVFETQNALFGAYPAVYGLIGAYTFLLWARPETAGGRGLSAFTLIGFLMFIQLVFGILFGAGKDWVAELAGFAAGFALSFVASPGGWASLVARLRRR